MDLWYLKMSKKQETICDLLFKLPPPLTVGSYNLYCEIGNFETELNTYRFWLLGIIKENTKNV